MDGAGAKLFCQSLLIKWFDEGLLIIFLVNILMVITAWACMSVKGPVITSRFRQHKILHQSSEQNSECFFISPTARLTIHTQSFPCTPKHGKNSNLNTNQIFHTQEIKPSNREKAHFSCLMWGCMHTLLYLTLLYLKFWI